MTANAVALKVAIVIPVFNQAHYTRKCLDGLRADGIPEDRIVVVDNASKDDTGAVLGAHPQLHVVRNEVNLGCGAAWNQGARALEATWTILLNNDVLIPPGWLKGLMTFAESERIDVVTPGICNGDDDYDFASFANEFMRIMARARRCGVANGICFMVHRRVFESAGYFDDDPRLGGYEDDEFFRRARRAGFRLAITGRSFLHHYGSVTQRAMKAASGRPAAGLGDRGYYRRKYGHTWLKRHGWRLARHLQQFRWRTLERLRYGRTLVSDRRNGRFYWK